MLEKIKSVIMFFIRGMTSGWRGLLGAAMLAFSIYLCAGLFTGTTNIQNYIRNRRELGEIDARIEMTRNKLKRTNNHIKLLSEGSPDFTSEMALKHLNLGDPNLMILKK